MEFRIKEAREKAGYSQRELASILEIAPSTLNGYESGKHDPKSDFLVKIAQACNVTVDYLLQYETATKNTPSISDEAMSIARHYDTLDAHGKEMVTLTVDCERRRVKQDAPERGTIVELFPTRNYIQSASAGYGDFNDDDSYEMVDLVKRPPAGASYIIKINGDSMEPTFNDGDHLFVRAQETLEIGEIGVFSKGPDLFVKEYGPDGLVSRNAAYPIIRGTEDEPIRIHGKVLGVCTEDYFFNP